MGILVSDRNILVKSIEFWLEITKRWQGTISKGRQHRRKVCSNEASQPKNMVRKTVRIILRIILKTPSFPGISVYLCLL